jgi:hypothetical protein
VAVEREELQTQPSGRPTAFDARRAAEMLTNVRRTERVHRPVMGWR